MSYVHPTAVVDEGAKLGADCRIWHFTHVYASASIGARVVLGQNVMVGSDVVVGAGTHVQNNVSLYAGVELSEDVFCGPSCVFTNVLNPRAFVERKDEFRRTVVGRGASIGANATIVCGVSLGDYCMVGAGAVVTRDVPAYALAYGNPARMRGWVSRVGELLGDSLVCERTGECYELHDGHLHFVDTKGR